MLYYCCATKTLFYVYAIELLYKKLYSVRLIHVQCAHVQDITSTINKTSLKLKPGCCYPVSCNTSMYATHNLTQKYAMTLKQINLIGTKRSLTYHFNHMIKNFVLPNLPLVYHHRPREVVTLLLTF